MAELAALAKMSARNLTRMFKEATGTTLNEYLTQIRKDKARELLNDSKNTMSFIATECGFKTERQLQRILRNRR